VQLTNLLQQRLKLRVVDRHDPKTVERLVGSLALSPDALEVTCRTGEGLPSAAGDASGRLRTLPLSLSARRRLTQTSDRISSVSG
jgi:hypothetical protein